MRDHDEPGLAARRAPCGLVTCSGAIERGRRFGRDVGTKGRDVGTPGCGTEQAAAMLERGAAMMLRQQAEEADAYEPARQDVPEATATLVADLIRRWLCDAE